MMLKNYARRTARGSWVLACTWAGARRASKVGCLYGPAPTATSDRDYTAELAGTPRSPPQPRCHPAPQQKAAEEAHRRELAGARREAEELQKRLAAQERRVVQLQHEVKRKEKEYERLQEK